METLCEFLFHALLHLVERPHPYQAIDGDTHLAATEGSVEQPFAIPQIQQGRLHAKKHGRIVAHRFIEIRYGLVTLLDGGHKLIALHAEFLTIVWNIVLAQLGQRGTLAHPYPLAIRQTNQPYIARRIDPTAGACGLLEVQRTLC